MQTHYVRCIDRPRGKLEFIEQFIGKLDILAISLLS